MDDAVIANILLRLNRLMAVMSEGEIDSQIRQGENGIPYLEVNADDREIRILSLPADGDNNRFLLELSTVLFSQETPPQSAEEVDVDAMVTCAQFNAESLFGYAAYIPIEGTVELRAQALEESEMTEPDRYTTILGLFLQSADDFTDMWMQGQEE